MSKKKDDSKGLTQFNIVGGRGFAPTTPTKESLDAGIYRIVEMQQQYVFLPHTFPTDALIRFPDSKSDEVIAEIKRFWGLREKFDAFGFTHKRGVLLYGPPGTGKTSTLVQIMENHVADDGLVILGDTHPSVLTDMLVNLREVEPDRKLLVVMEDVEVIARFGSVFTALLDGEKSIGGVVFLATTNYIDQLEERVKARPSRFDQVIEIGPPPRVARELYLKSRNIPADQLEAWLDLTDGFSFAHLKELIVSVAVFGAPLKEQAERLAKMLQIVIDKPKKSSYQMRDADYENEHDE